MGVEFFFQIFIPYNFAVCPIFRGSLSFHPPFFFLSFQDDPSSKRFLRLQASLLKSTASILRFSAFPSPPFLLSIPPLPSLNPLFRPDW